jgi:hypothetical protein
MLPSGPSSVFVFPLEKKIHLPLSFPPFLPPCITPSCVCVCVYLIISIYMYTQKKGETKGGRSDKDKAGGATTAASAASSSTSSANSFCSVDLSRHFSSSPTVSSAPCSCACHRGGMEFARDNATAVDVGCGGSGWRYEGVWRWSSR